MKTSAPPENTYLTVEQVAKRLNVPTQSIWRWKRAGKVPLAVRVGPMHSAEVERHPGV